MQWTWHGTPFVPRLLLNLVAQHEEPCQASAARDFINSNSKGSHSWGRKYVGLGLAPKKMPPSNDLWLLYCPLSTL